MQSFSNQTSDFTKISQPNGVTCNISNHTVRWEIFQRMSKKFHGWFDLTDKAAESLQTDPFATSHSRTETLARRTVTLSKKRQRYSSVASVLFAS